MGPDGIAEFWLWQLVGRLHPLVVHFPIGLLVTGLFLEALTLGRRRPELRAGIRWLIYLGAGGALLAAAQGWLLAAEGGYASRLVESHRWLGTSTAVLALGAAWLLFRAERSGRAADRHLYRGVLAASVLALTVAGHYGAMVTHGRDYLTGALPWNQPAEARPSTGRTAELLAGLAHVRQIADTSVEQLDQLNLAVRGIFAHNCYQCHSSDRQEHGLRLDGREAVFAGGDGGPILQPGRADASEIVRRLRLPRDHEEAMPPDGRSISADEIALITRWIDLGAHWTDEAIETFREAELRLVMPDVPNGPAELHHPLDRLVDAYFARHGIDWPGPVPDAQFIRRAYLDVTGLLPEPGALEAFVADTRQDKRARLVDDLLAREHDYAQHWLTFWNDLLRNDYSGTGFITGGRLPITPWLYEQLVANAPYVEMVRQLVDPQEASQGFIRGIEWRGDINASQRTEMQAAQNISQSFLGLNLKCASCHNSFVSNLTLEQAYGFANVFAEAALEIERCDVPTGELAKTAFVYPELGEVDGALPKEERLRQLADILTSPANGRLYRTIANRYWRMLFGRGLVEPVDEMDNLPWSQEVLDWLAADSREHGADLKQLMRTILTSKTYQLPSVGLADAADVTSDAFVFRGPLPRRLSAEQFADALSQTVSPVYAAVAFDPFDIEADARWIWFDARQDGRQALPSPGTYYFRRTFDLPPRTGVAEASLLVAVDDAFQLFVNGEAVAAGRDWREVQRLDIADRLRTGSNLLAIQAENAGAIPNPAGVLLNLRVTLADGRLVEVTSDGTWKAVDEAPGEGWQRAMFDDGAWQEVRSFGTHGSNPHWGRLVGFMHDPDAHPLPFARASLVYNDPFLRALGRPVRDNVVTARADEATLLQALELTNGPFLDEALARGAREWLERYRSRPEAMVEQLYLRALGRRPIDPEREAAASVLGAEPDTEAVQDLLWALVLLPEFQLIQ